MKELLNQDLFDQIKTSDAVCITTNCTVLEDGTNPMGGGSAGAAARRWPDLPGVYGRLLTITPHVPVILGWVERGDLSKFVSVFATPDQCLKAMYGDTCAIVAYPTMDEITEPADLNLVMQNACLLADMADSSGWKSIVLGRPGCGIGGLVYDDLKLELADVLDDRFTIIHRELSVARRTFVLN